MSMRSKRFSQVRETFKTIVSVCVNSSINHLLYLYLYMKWMERRVCVHSRNYFRLKKLTFHK